MIIIDYSKEGGKKLKIAIATEGREVAAHFGRCPMYTIVDIENDQIVNKEVIANPGHEPGFLPGYLAQKGVQCVIAGGAGPRAKSLFAEQEIEIITGVSGSVDSALEHFINGTLETGADTCDH